MKSLLVGAALAISCAGRPAPPPADPPRFRFVAGESHDWFDILLMEDTVQARCLLVVQRGQEVATEPWPCTTEAQ